MPVARRKTGTGRATPLQAHTTNGHARAERAEMVADYRLAFRSRQASILGRREVLTGKAKFGIFGDGKELPQLAMAKVFLPGDFRSGYYRDQTFAFARGMATVREMFAQLYAHTDLEAEPASGGRGMNCHFGSRALNADGSWRDLTAIDNSASDVSPTGTQLPRVAGLAYASRLYRELEELRRFTEFSHHGDEVAFATIGNASCAEGMFWETVNAVGVLQGPMILSIWDDDYGISVTNELELTKGNLSELLAGFRRRGTGDGYELFTVRGWDYPALLETYHAAEQLARRDHVPVLIHVTELTQPLGHSTSGSQERYKSKERLAWEREHDCLTKMRAWILESGYASAAELASWEVEDTAQVKAWRDEAWAAYCAPIAADVTAVCGLLDELATQVRDGEAVTRIRAELAATREPTFKDARVAIHRALLATRDEPAAARTALLDWKRAQAPRDEDRFHSHLYSASRESALLVAEIPAVYSDASPTLQGFEVLNACFDAMLARDPRVIAFGEDVGKLGDVNQGFMNLQAKYGPLRVSDTGIREATILGQAIGMAMRGLRPIAEIQYLDYILYALQVMSDDLATLQYRTKGGQKAPVIVRTRGHRLEGIWHSGSPMAGIVNLVRGMHVLVPRNMVQAAGFYNTMLRSDEPALIIEVLNAYRLKERRPDNIDTFTVPLGVPETLRAGTDVTIVTYGACCRIALEAADLLAQAGIEAEIIDVQTLLPFDRHDHIARAVERTGRVLFLDEDVPGGASAFMMQQVLEREGAYRVLDAAPRTLSARDHRPAYGTDGNYWSKPNVEDVFETVYAMLHEADPRRWNAEFA